MVTHDLEYLDKCDRVLLLKPGGQMVFYGAADEGLRYFGKSRWVEVYRALRAEPERDWAGEFEQSSCYLQYVASGLTGQVPDSARGPSEPPPAPRSRLAQLTILCRRYTTLIAADRGFLISLAVVPIVFGGRAAAARLPGPRTLGFRRDRVYRQPQRPHARERQAGRRALGSPVLRLAAS